MSKTRETKRDYTMFEDAMPAKKNPDGTGCAHRSFSLPLDLLQMITVEARALGWGKSRLITERLRRSYAAEEQKHG